MTSLDDSNCVAKSARKSMERNVALTHKDRRELTDKAKQLKVQFADRRHRSAEGDELDKSSETSDRTVIDQPLVAVQTPLVRMLRLTMTMNINLPFSSVRRARNGSVSF